MGDLEHRLQAAEVSLPKRELKAHNTQVGRIVVKTKLAGLKVDSEAAVAGRGMERVVDIHNYARSLAGGDNELLAVLSRLELGFIEKVERLQRNFGSELGL